MTKPKLNKASDNVLDEIRLLLNKNPDFIFNKIKGLFKISEKSGDNIKKYSKLIEKGFAPVIYGNHQSHADGVIISFIIEQVIKNLPDQTLKGFLCPIAASMESGDQNDNVQGGLDIFYSILEKKGFITIPVIREDDRKKYGMTGSNREVIEKLLHAPQNKFGLVVFPEGRVQGGRLKKDGSIYGMQQVTTGGILLRCLNFWQGQGRGSVLLPVGVLNSYQIFSPDNYQISKTMFEMVKGEKKVEKVINIEIGTPFTNKKMQKDLGSNPDPRNQEHIDYLMYKIAKLLPRDAKGYYGKD